MLASLNTIVSPFDPVALWTGEIDLSKLYNYLVNVQRLIISFHCGDKVALPDFVYKYMTRHMPNHQSILQYLQSIDVFHVNDAKNVFSHVKFVFRKPDELSYKQ